MTNICQLWRPTFPFQSGDFRLCLAQRKGGFFDRGIDTDAGLVG